MIGLEQVLAEQSDIETLCKPKTSKSLEIYGANNNYGFAYVMKSYAEYPLEEPIYATFPHGIYLRDRVVGLSELQSPLPGHLNFPPFTNQLWKKLAKNKRIIPFAAPIHYALKLFKSEVPKESRQGTLFLPKHSTKVVDVSFDKEAMVAELQSLPESFHPITVCVHWQDVEKGLHKYFKEKGFNVVSAGHLYDDMYMFRWLHLVSQFKLVAHSGIGSALFYSVLADHPFYMTKEQTTSVADSKFQLFNKDKNHYSKAAVTRERRLMQLFSEPKNEVTSEQLELVRYFTQADSVLAPAKLRELFASLRTAAKR